MQNAITWFELPTRNFDRAVSFYSTVLGKPLRTGEFMGVPHGFFPVDEGGVAGAVIASEAVPGENGVLIYLNAGDQLDTMLGRVEVAGGKVLQPKTDIAPQGYFAVLLDTEGNRVGLHQPPM